MCGHDKHTCPLLVHTVNVAVHFSVQHCHKWHISVETGPVHRCDSQIGTLICPLPYRFVLRFTTFCTDGICVAKIVQNFRCFVIVQIGCVGEQCISPQIFQSGYTGALLRDQSKDSLDFSDTIISDHLKQTGKLSWLTGSKTSTRFRWRTRPTPRLLLMLLLSLQLVSILDLAGKTLSDGLLEHASVKFEMFCGAPI